MIGKKERWIKGREERKKMCIRDRIADALMDYLKPKGVMVMVEAEHMCMTMRGIKKPGSKTVTVVKRGIFQEEKERGELFFQMLR